MAHPHDTMDVRHDAAGEPCHPAESKAPKGHEGHGDGHKGYEGPNSGEREHGMFPPPGFKRGKKGK
jgi:hypothetical protein